MPERQGDGVFHLAVTPTFLSTWPWLRSWLDKDTYSFHSLGATVNMAGAAVTITVMALAAVNTFGFKVDFPTDPAQPRGIASAAGTRASPVDPLGSHWPPFFGIPGDIPMQVVGVGFIIGVLQTPWRPL